VNASDKAAAVTTTTYLLQQARASDLVVVRGNRDNLVPDPLLGRLDPGDFAQMSATNRKTRKNPYPI
jgi:hypothetical protein